MAAGDHRGVSSLVSIGAVGIHGQPWPDVSRPVRAERAGQLRALNRLRAEALGIEIPLRTSLLPY